MAKIVKEEDKLSFRVGVRLTESEGKRLIKESHRQHVSLGRAARNLLIERLIGKPAEKVV
jgi:hypothetical protein